MGGIGHCLLHKLTFFCFARSALFLASGAGFLVITLEFGRGTGLARLRHSPCLSLLSPPPNPVVSAVIMGCRVPLQEVPETEEKLSDINGKEPWGRLLVLARCAKVRTGDQKLCRTPGIGTGVLADLQHRHQRRQNALGRHVGNTTHGTGHAVQDDQYA